MKCNENEKFERSDVRSIVGASDDRDGYEYEYEYALMQNEATTEYRLLQIAPWDPWMRKCCSGIVRCTQWMRNRMCSKRAETKHAWSTNFSTRDYSRPANRRMDLFPTLCATLRKFLKVIQHHTSSLSDSSFVTSTRHGGQWVSFDYRSSTSKSSSFKNQTKFQSNASSWLRESRSPKLLFWEPFPETPRVMILSVVGVCWFILLKNRRRVFLVDRGFVRQCLPFSSFSQRIRQALR